MSDKRGLYNKYAVSRNDGKPISEGCIVLEFKDPAARLGIKAFATAVGNNGYATLKRDILRELSKYDEFNVDGILKKTMTCYTCPDSSICKDAWDSYNMYGECLAK